MSFKLWISLSFFIIVLMVAIMPFFNYKLSQFSYSIRLGPTKLSENATNAKHYSEINYHFQKYSSLEEIPNVHSSRVNCQELVDMDNSTYKRVQQIEHYKISIKDEENKLFNLLEDCNKFKMNRKYITKPINLEEEQFPIAYAIFAHKDGFQIERLLRAIYRPQNAYCIHIDNRTKSDQVYAIFKRLEGCFSNVIVAENRVTVKWGSYSQLHAQIICMKHLVHKHKSWKYFINLAGQEFPLKTNLDVVKVLQIFSGANAIESLPFKKKYRLRHYDKDYRRSTARPLAPFKYNITFFKGSIFMAGSRAFVEYILKDRFAQDLLDYLKPTLQPDETFYPTLNKNYKYGVPGSYNGTLFPKDVTRYVHWLFRKSHSVNHENVLSVKHDGTFWCHGKIQRMICVIGIGDLKQVVESPHLFVNKLEATYSPVTYDCLEELLFLKIKDEITGIHKLDLSYYRQLDFVKNHI